MWTYRGMTSERLAADLTDRYPGTGPELVRAALASWVIRVRRAALRLARPAA